MATLEKIRSKSVLLLIIVGAALLAFIIGDFFTSGRTLFGTGTTIAKVGDQKVDVQEFQRRVQQVQQQEQQAGRHTDAAVLQQQVLDQMIQEKLFNQEVQQLGITVTDEELTEAMLGKNSQNVSAYLQAYGMPDAATFHDMAFNAAKYGLPQEQAAQFQQMWIELERNVEQGLLQQKFQNLFGGVIAANDLDTKAFYDELSNTANVVYARKDFSTLPDDEYTAEKSEIQKLYDEEKESHKINEPARMVQYIAVNITPSDADVAAGEKAVAEALIALNEQPETQGLADKQEFVVDRVKISQDDLAKQARLKATVDSLAIGQAGQVQKSGYNYSLVKLLGKSQQTDKVKLDFLAVQGTAAEVDSLTALLNAGTPFDTIAASPLVAQSQKAQEVSLLDPQAQQIAALIADKATGVYFAPDTLAQGGRILRVAERNAPVTVYELANVTYVTEPSNATINGLEADLQNYVSTHKTAKEFTDSASANGFVAFPALVSASTPVVGSVPDSHSAVAWAMDADKGDVSPVFGDAQSDRLIAVAVEDVYSDGYIPVRNPNLYAQLAARVRNDKKAAKLLADYEGKAKDVAGYAQLMGVSVDTTQVNFSQPMISGIGFGEGAIQGKVANAKPGQLVGPVKGSNAVVVLQVVGIDNEGRPFDAEETAVRYGQQRGAQALGQIFNQILVGNKKVKNNINAFYK